MTDTGVSQPVEIVSMNVPCVGTARSWAMSEPTRSQICQGGGLALEGSGLPAGTGEKRQPISPLVPLPRSILPRISSGNFSGVFG